MHAIIPRKPEVNESGASCAEIQLMSTVIDLGGQVASAAVRPKVVWRSRLTKDASQPSIGSQYPAGLIFAEQI